MGCITSNNNFVSENTNRFDVIYADTTRTLYHYAELEISGI
jgi:hypothetical protein